MSVFTSVLNYLNKAISTDVEAAQAFLNTRVPCNAETATKLKITEVDDKGVPQLGFLSVINSMTAYLCYAAGEHIFDIVLDKDDEGTITGFLQSMPITEVPRIKVELTEDNKLALAGEDQSDVTDLVTFLNTDPDVQALLAKRFPKALEAE